MERPGSRLRSLRLAAVILTVIALGLGGWLGYVLLATQETEVTAEIQAVIDDYHNAWNDHDSEAFLRLVTSGYRFYDTPGVMGDDAEETARMIGQQLRSLNWQVEQVGPSQMIGDETTVQVGTVNRITATGFTGEGVSVLTLVKVGDDWMVGRQVFTGN